MSRDAAILQDILNAAGLAIGFTEGMDQESFHCDAKTQSAVIHQLLIVGEAVKRLSSEYRDSHGSVPWKLMAGMRDKLIHGYDSVDIDLVWQTIDQEIPNILPHLRE